MATATAMLTVVLAAAAADAAGPWPLAVAAAEAAMPALLTAAVSCAISWARSLARRASATASTALAAASAAAAASSCSGIHAWEKIASASEMRQCSNSTRRCMKRTVNAVWHYTQHGCGRPMAGEPRRNTRTSPMLAAVLAACIALAPSWRAVAAASGAAADPACRH